MLYCLHKAGSYYMEIELWESNNGHSPAGDFIEELDGKVKRKIFQRIEEFETYGLKLLQSGHLKKLSGYNIYELRISFNKQHYRLLGVIQESRFLILHGFNKKSRETPLKEIRVTLNRSSELIIQLNKSRPAKNQ